MRAPILVALLGLCGAACVDDRSVELRVPAVLQVSPSPLVLPEVEVGMSSRGSLTLWNLGEGKLPLGAPTLGAEPGFAVEPVGSMELSSQGKSALEVRFEARAAGRFTTRLELHPDYSALYPELLGDGTVGVEVQVEAKSSVGLQLFPDPLDFGQPILGCGASRRTLFAASTLDSGDITLEQFALGSPRPFGAFPLPQRVLGPREVIAWTFVLEADGAGRDQTSLMLTASSPGGSAQLEVQLIGETVEARHAVEEYDLSPGAPRDILFVVDDSGSMRQEQERLSQNFAAFIALAEMSAADYHIAVTTTDTGDGQPAEAGRFVPLSGSAADRVVTRGSEPSPAARFEANAQVGIDARTEVEQGLKAAVLALSPALLAGPNSGFLRAEAALSIIIVSDENDQSEEEAEVFINQLLALKPVGQLVISAIAGPPPVGCLGPDGSAVGGDRYQRAVRATGGAFESICSRDWSETLRVISESTFGLRRSFPFREPARPESVRVFMDGRELGPLTAPSWSYDARLNGVVFDADPPRAGAHLRFEYDVACAR